MNITLHAPQLVFLLVVIMELIIFTVKHGQSRDDYNAFVKVLDLAILIALLAWGGFFG
jgi:hypothetical protein